MNYNTKCIKFVFGFYERRVIILVSDNFSKPTPAQAMKDAAFVQSVKNDLVPGIVNELRELYPRFDEMPAIWRVKCLVTENARHYSKERYSDGLLIEYGSLKFIAYAGVELFDSAQSYWDLDNGCEITYRKPFFDNDISGSPKGEDAKAFFNSVRKSDLAMYLYGENPMGRLDFEHMPKYTELPVAYRAALVCQYVHEHVIATLSDVTAFVLGASETLATHRYIFEPTKDADGLNNGWVIRIRDLRPIGDLGKHIAAHISDVVANSEAMEQEHQAVSSQFEQKERKRRGADNVTETMVEFVFKLKQTRKIGSRRGDDLSWDEALAQLESQEPTTIGRYKNGNNLRDSFNSYVKRHPVK